MEKLIVLDRDGVINEDSDDYIKSPEEYIPIPGSLEAISKLNKAGYTVVVATNQSGLARGYFDQNTLDNMHQKLSSLLAASGGSIEKIYVCPHGPDDNCDCRKPKPGLLLQILADHDVKSSDVIAIGDSLRDLQAARAVNMVPVLVRTGKGASTEAGLKNNGQNAEQFADVNIFDNLSQAVDAVLGND
jgi:D-glycero-D-manno-heptose 1,7-bisphosphate phosphatase